MNAAAPTPRPTPPVYTLQRGSSPLLVSLPHVGTRIPPDQQARYVPRALDVEDTDWFLDRLYAFATDLGATLLVPLHSRYLIDLNRPRENTPMYPGVNNTELCPTRFFTGESLYQPGQAPDDAEVQRRVTVYWQPYHDALDAELARLRSLHGHAVLFDGHSIKAEVPWLFEGRLPDLNLGTADGRSCAPGLRARATAVLAERAQALGYSQVTDGRFKGGHITRHHGQPAQGLHALQMEMGWHCVMDDSGPPYTYDPKRAEAVRGVLQPLLRALTDWRPD